MPLRRLSLQKNYPVKYFLTRAHYCGSIRLCTTAVVQKGESHMDNKLFDSELKVMDTLWREGELPARRVADILGT